MDLLGVIGRFDEAVAEVAIALDLDPLCSIGHDSRALLSIFRREYHDAIAACRRILDADPTFYKSYTTLGRAWSMLGNYTEALAMLEKGRELAGDMNTILSAIGEVRARSGDREGARRILDQLTAREAHAYVPANCFAIVHLGLGERDAALGWLERGCERHDLPLVSCNVHPLYDELRGEARFQDVLRRMNFPR
jgi:serine/threonine-protein kinase